MENKAEVNKHNLHHYFPFWLAILLIIISFFSPSTIQTMLLQVAGVGFIAIAKVEMVIDNQKLIWKKLK